MHHDINFLPWRTEKLHSKGKRSLTLFLFIIITISSASMAYRDKLYSQIQRQEESAIAMSKQLAEMNNRRAEYEALQKRRDEMVSQWQWLRSKQAQRNNIIEVMNLVPELIPVGIYLDAIYYQDPSVVIKGRSTNSDAVDMLLVNLHSFPRVDKVHFEFLEADNLVPRYDQLFSLSFSVMPMTEEKGG